MTTYMKPAYLLMVTILLFPGCLEEHVRTTISADGSSERVISMKVSKKELPEKAFPAPSDSSWTIEWKETGEKETKYEYIARKSFRTPEELHREFESHGRGNGLTLDVTVEKRFEWFFTYFDYKETYLYKEPLAIVPISQYLTPEEIDRYQHGESNDTLSLKVKMWSSRNLFEGFYRPLVAEAQRRNDPALSESLLVERKEECFQALMTADSIQESRKAHGDSTGIKLDTPSEIVNFLAGVLQNRTVLTLQPVAEEAMEKLEAKESQVKQPDSWMYEVKMPGLILEANSNTIEGNMITWKFKPEQINVGDYTMRASSRVANPWAFVITGILALLVLPIVMRVSGRRKAAAPL